MDLEKLAYWTCNEWSYRRVLECFSADPHGYWHDKFDSDILRFYLSLDDYNRDIFSKYLGKKLEDYSAK